MAGLFLTLYEAEVKIELPELSIKALFYSPSHVSNQKSNYNVIFD